MTSCRKKYACRYGERLVFIKKVPVNVCGHEAYVYLCIDEDMYLMQHKKTILNALDDKKDFDETDVAIKKTWSLHHPDIGRDIRREASANVSYTAAGRAGFRHK